MLTRPERGDCHDYYFTYIDQVPEGDVFQNLEDGFKETLSLLRSVPSDRETFAYAEGKWTLREMVGHVLDTERLFGFRAFWFARGAAEALPGMEQDEFAGVSNAGHRPLGSLVAELEKVRASNMALFRSFDEKAWGRSGNASGSEVKVSALPFIIAGHEAHHRKVLHELYLNL